MKKPNIPTKGALRIALVIAGVAIAYFVTGRLLLALSAPPNGAVTTVWLPSGISVAAMVLFGPWVAVGSFIGAIALELKMGTPWPATVMVGIANAGSELLCYYIIAGRRARGFSIAEFEDGVRLLAGALTASVISAFVGVGAYVGWGVVPASAYWSNWLTWFGSAAIGIALIMPFLVYSARAWPPMGSRSRQLEYVAALAVLAIAGYLWQGPVFTRDADEPTILCIIFGLLWTAFRFSPAAMTLSVFVFAVSAVGGAVSRLGQESPVTAYVAIFSLQLMLGGLAMIGYLLAAMVEKQRRSKLALEAAQGEVVAQARRAGMAEIAINVLHEVGNVLNSVNVSAGLIGSKLRASRTRGLSQAVGLMNAHSDNLGRFLTEDEKGKLLPQYLDQVAQALTAEQSDLIGELAHLAHNIDHIKEVVAMQQDFARHREPFQPIQQKEALQ